MGANPVKMAENPEGRLRAIICSSHELYNTRQDRSPYFDINPYFNLNNGDAINRRNFEYQPYQPNYAPPKLHPYQYPRHGDEAYFQPRTGSPQFPQYNVHERSVPVPELQPIPLPLPLPYQGNAKKIEEETVIEDKIRSIFYMGPEKNDKLLNTTLDPKLSSLDRMHADESYNGNDENTTNLPSIQSSTSSITGMASASSMPKPTLSPSASMNNEEPSFKVQRTPDGKLSLVFNDILSLQRPTAPQIPQPRYPPTVNKRPNIVFPSTPISDTAFNGCEHYEGQSLCASARNYPNLARLNNILHQEFSQLGVFFAEDEEQPFNISQRFGGDPDEIDPCASVERTVYPEAGQTLDSRWVLIVNDKLSYKQGVRIEECIGKDRPCDTINEFLPNSYRSVCKQSYVFRSLIALSENGTVIKEQFRIPSCCKCVLRLAKRS